MGRATQKRLQPPHHGRQPREHKHRLLRVRVLKVERPIEPEHRHGGEKEKRKEKKALELHMGLGSFGSLRVRR